MSTKPPVQFELPKAYELPDETPYKPSASHDAQIADARRQFPAGTLVLAQQRVGALTAQFFVEKMVEGLPEDAIRFGSKLITAASIGSAQYSFRDGRPAMRRHVPLPLVVDPETGEHTELVQRLEQTTETYRRASQLSTAVWREMALCERVATRTSHDFGRAAAAAGLWVALLPHPELGNTGTALVVQREVRRVGMDALVSTKQLNDTVGVRITLAMLGTSAVTNLSAYVEGSAPHAAYSALYDAKAQAEQTLGMKAA